MSRALVVLVLAGGVMARGASAWASVGRDDDGARGNELHGCKESSTARVDPVSELRESDLELSAILRRRVPSWSPEADAARSRLEHLLAGILDYEGIARRALGTHWSALSAPQRRAFLTVFSPLTNQALITAAGRRVSVLYDSEQISGAEATVVVTPKLADGATADLERLEYRLVFRCNRWLVEDVVVDGVSLVEGYQRQFDRLLRRESFDDVLATLRRKLDGRAPK